MSNIATFSTLHEKVNQVFSENDDEPIGIAFMRFCLKLLFRLNEEEIEETITDGPQDGEIDAIYIEGQFVHLLTFKYTNDFSQSLKSFPGTDIDQFSLTVDQVISGSLSKATINDAVWDKYEEIQELASKGRVEFKLHIVSNKEQPEDSSKQKLEHVISKYKLVERPIYYDQEKLVTILLDTKSEKINGKIRFIDRQHFDKSDGNISTVIGVVSASDIIELIKDEKDDKSVNEAIFNENVRVYKPRHRVNKAIIESAKADDNFQFFYLNNGVTILCEKSDYTPNRRNPVVELENLQIINGGQTSRSIFNAYLQDPEKVQNVDLLLRVCIARKDDAISEMISETSNNQIPIGNRDLHANDLIQRKLQEQFDSLGYRYERKPNQYEKSNKSKVLNNELLGQLYMAYHLDMPSEAKNNKTKVFNDLYDSIFDENILEARELLRLYKLYEPLIKRKKIIQRKKRNKEKVNEKEAFVSRALFHIVHGTKYFFEKAKNEVNMNDEFSSREKRVKLQEIYDIRGDEFIEASINVIAELVSEEMENRGDLYTHDKFFKESNTNVLLINKFRKIN